MKAVFSRIVAVIALSFATCIGVSGGYADPAVEVVSKFSGKPVPRFESLRYSAVHGRQGPSLDHPILWRYEKQGLPMLIVRETNGWRRVRDRDGDEVWVQARMLSDQRRVALIQDQIMYRKPDTGAAGRAALKSGVIADLDRCEANWCHIKIARRSGWVPKAVLWGVETDTGGL